MSEFPPIPSDDESALFWNKKRIGLVVLVIFLLVILIGAVLVSLMPTICCGVFPNIVNSL
jgi:hypothetical protein